MKIKHHIHLLVPLIIAMAIIGSSIEIPLEEPYDNYTTENLTVLYYLNEDIEIFRVDNDTYGFNYPKINTTISLGEFKWKSVDRLLYLNESGFNDTVRFILTLRKPLNESELDNISARYNITIDVVKCFSEDGSGEFSYPINDTSISILEEIVAELEATYSNNSNFTFPDEYVGVKAHGNISNIMDLLYDNNTFCIDPGPYDLINDYPTASFIPTSYLYYEYSNYTTCNGTLRTNQTDLDGDLFLVCEGDCNDSNKSIHPGATEIKDGIDNDCDGLVDEGFECTGISPPVFGDWNITQSTQCIDTSIFLSFKSILRFFNNQILTLQNATLHMNSSGIDFGEGGTLVLDNTTIFVS